MHAPFLLMWSCRSTVAPRPVSNLYFSASSASHPGSADGSPVLRRPRFRRYPSLARRVFRLYFRLPTCEPRKGVVSALSPGCRRKRYRNQVSAGKRVLRPYFPVETFAPGAHRAALNDRRASGAWPVSDLYYATPPGEPSLRPASRPPRLRLAVGARRKRDIRRASAGPRVSDLYFSSAWGAPPRRSGGTSTCFGPLLQRSARRPRDGRRSPLLELGSR